ncbi:MAG: SDR family NAD(P)-dependent oxidoreductase [Acidithiobacillus ferrivorans]|uniref:SDR family NAD(P)-dependent oxidoreductase n=1 Tax=Acidithiobacillus ferrivorans TaxID=160808 RepID=UPI0008938B6C|nr:SDR family oxidoreductase [Acidithiobacillus ferrivorans]MBU2767578.1 SDR family oxidoreductase [Acidithiobacillus ferrivorans]OFA16255.1 short-chain dehydrogenase [Acidithiobacillus ferrivorans]
MTDNPRVALVTGSTSGIGLAIAQRLTQAGYWVALHSRASSVAGLQEAAAMENTKYFQADLLDEGARKDLIDSVYTHYGRLDVLVNNAGESSVIPHDDLLAATPDIWHRLYELHVVAPWQLVALSEPYLRAASSADHPASVLNISSHAGVRPKGASIPYAASKAALIHVTRLLAKTLGPDIRVNAIAPGLVDTPLTEDWAAIREQWIRDAPMRRSASPKDITDVALMLTESAYLTGEVIVVDGGMNLL